MSLSAAKLALILLAPLSGDTTPQASPKTVNAIMPMVVTVQSEGKPTGVAAMLSPDGRFIAHRSAVGMGELTVKRFDGTTIKVRLTSTDDVTGLVLLESEESEKKNNAFAKNGGGASAAEASYDSIRSLTFKNPPIVNKSKQGQTVYVVSLEGLIKGEITSTERFGVNSSSRRALTFSEIRFESLSSAVGGALAFTPEGSLVGILGASLVANRQDTPQRETSLNQGVGTVGGGLGNSLGKSVESSQYGPGKLTVMYSITPDILARVIDGFNSPSRKVEHPALGLMVQDGGESAKIVSVTKGSPAEKAGLKAGDEIIFIGSDKVTSQFEYTRCLMRLRVGQTISVTYIRNNSRFNTMVKVGS